MHSRCVHTAEKALNSPDAVCTRTPGLFPNLKIFPELGGTSLNFAATTEFSVDSTICGGDIKRKIGYKIAASVAKALVPSRKSRKLRRGGDSGRPEFLFLLRVSGFTRSSLIE